MPRKLNAQPGRWHFLTGDKDTIYRLSRDGFKLATDEGGAAGPIHSTRMVLVDRSGTIRGYYDATDADAVTRLLADTSHLQREQPAPAAGGSGFLNRFTFRGFALEILPAIQAAMEFCP